MSMRVYVCMCVCVCVCVCIYVFVYGMERHAHKAHFLMHTDVTKKDIHVLRVFCMTVLFLDVHGHYSSS